METITTIVGALGFPIVACVFMWRFIDSTLREFRETMAENTKMLGRICDKLDMWQEVESDRDKH